MRILSDAEIVELGRIKLGINKIDKLIAHLNALTLATGLPLRRIDKTQFALLENDISILARGHELAEDAIKISAMKILEGNNAAQFGVNKNG